MKPNLTNKELDVAKEIINIGLGKAADSMAFFTKNKVLIRSFDLQLKSIESTVRLSEKPSDELLYVLTTELKGDLGGVCYLLFSEAEVQEIVNVSLPSSILNDEAKKKLMTDAILLEMDNIISAAVITQFSNFFNYKTYGDVPQLSKTLPNGFTQLAQSTSKTAKYILYFKSDFQTTGMNINPEFIWLLDDQFIEGVKNVAKTQEEEVE